MLSRKGVSHYLETFTYLSEAKLAQIFASARRSRGRFVSTRHTKNIFGVVKKSAFTKVKTKSKSRREERNWRETLKT